MRVLVWQHTSLHCFLSCQYHPKDGEIPRRRTLAGLLALVGMPVTGALRDKTEGDMKDCACTLLGVLLRNRILSPKTVRKHLCGIEQGVSRILVLGSTWNPHRMRVPRSRFLYKGFVYGFHLDLRGHCLFDCLFHCLCVCVCFCFFYFQSADTIARHPMLET